MSGQTADSESTGARHTEDGTARVSTREMLTIRKSKETASLCI